MVSSLVAWVIGSGSLGLLDAFSPLPAFASSSGLAPVASTSSSVLPLSDGQSQKEASNFFSEGLTQSYFFGRHIGTMPSLSRCMRIFE